MHNTILEPYALRTLENMIGALARSGGRSCPTIGYLRPNLQLNNLRIHIVSMNEDNRFNLSFREGMPPVCLTLKLGHCFADADFQNERGHFPGPDSAGGKKGEIRLFADIVTRASSAPAECKVSVEKVQLHFRQTLGKAHAKPHRHMIMLAVDYDLVEDTSFVVCNCRSNPSEEIGVLLKASKKVLGDIGHEKIL